MKIGACPLAVLLLGAAAIAAGFAAPARADGAKGGHAEAKPGVPRDAHGPPIFAPEISAGGPRMVHPGKNPTVITLPNRAAIGVTGIIRPGSGPSGVGGPAKMGAGINGTTIRPKH